MQVSADWKSFFRLLRNTKRLKWYKKSNGSRTEPAVCYHIKIRQKKYTVYLRTFEGDIDIFYEVFWKKVYQLPKTFSGGNENAFIDLGANIGMAALFFHIFYNPARIICVEPAAENFELLVKNTRNIKGVINSNVAVMATEGRVSITKEMLHYNNKVEMNNGADASVEAITLKRLYAQLEQPAVTVLKVDIEGAEEAVFNTDDRFLDTTDNVLIEIHSPAGENSCLQILRKKGFTVRPQIVMDEAATVFFARRG